jgi:biopolymer transport protein ExbB/TolQ
VKETTERRSQLRNTFFALLSTGAVFGLVYLVPHSSYVYKLFYERSPIQYLTTFFFWLAFWGLIVEHKLVKEEYLAFSAMQQVLEGLAVSQTTATMVSTDVHKVREAINKEFGDKFQKSSVLSRVLNGLERLQKTQSTSETREYFNTASDLDAADIDSNFSMIGYLVWLLPTLGLVGTVLGIGLGFSGFAEIINSAQDFSKVRTALPIVTQRLGTAFDCTLLAILLSVIIGLYASWLRGKADNVLTSIDKLCHVGVLPLFREYSHAMRELMEEFQVSTNRAIEAANANRIVIAGTLQSINAEGQEQNRRLQLIQGELKTLKDQTAKLEQALASATGALNNAVNKVP